MFSNVPRVPLALKGNADAVPAIVASANPVKAGYFILGILDAGRGRRGLEETLEVCNRKARSERNENIDLIASSTVYLWTGHPDHRCMRTAQSGNTLVELSSWTLLRDVLFS